MTAPADGRVRLSTYLVCVEYGDEVELQHTVRGTTQRIDRGRYDDLLTFRSFRAPDARHAEWLEAGVLVPPFMDTLEYHGGLRAGSEAQLGHEYQAWYWRHEVESEREYRWLGRSVLKMPSDLFFYQELMTTHALRSVLEIGHGDGGGLWFFGTVLSMLGGGQVVGVDWDGVRDVPPFRGLREVGLHLVDGDAHATETVERVRRVRPDGFDLVVIDADPTPEGKVRLLSRWAEVVSPGGYAVVEDVASPACSEEGALRGIDQFLLENHGFGVVIEAARFPLLKARGAVLRRDPDARDRG